MVECIRCGAVTRWSARDKWKVIRDCDSGEYIQISKDNLGGLCPECQLPKWKKEYDPGVWVEPPFSARYFMSKIQEIDKRLDKLERTPRWVQIVREDE
jgi:hypothetical protein